METITISRNELKKIIRKTFEDVLSDRKDLIGDAVVEAMEDIGLARAMEEGRTGEYIGVEKFKKKLDTRIKRSK
ncbi:MAG: hypothetical protein KJ963_06705 [Bacteroidetes bacterium]|nr:hypothetical protein [Bacteroidota bacterium]